MMPGFIHQTRAIKRAKGFPALALASERAYLDPPKFKEFYPGAIPVFDAETDSQAYVLADFEGSGATVATVRGTGVISGWSWNDIFRNVKMTRDRLNGCKVHRGYLGAVYALGQKLKPHNIDLFTGHSMGGSEATGLLKYPGNELARGVTFGAPSFGNRAFYDAVESRLDRVVFHNDIAPKHPRPWLGYRQSRNYWHLDHECILERRKYHWTRALVLPFFSAGIWHGKQDHRAGEAYAEHLAKMTVSL